MREVRDYINGISGFTVNARWLAEGPHGKSDSPSMPDDQLRTYAREDCEDIAACDALIMFADPQNHSGTAPVTGGRHVETGYALAFNKHVVIVGKRENVFSRLFNRADNIEHALVIIAMGAHGFRVEPGREGIPYATLAALPKES
jgi:nucleoside 2-deoxyribosyltransferase